MGGLISLFLTRWYPRRVRALHGDVAVALVGPRTRAANLAGRASMASRLAILDRYGHGRRRNTRVAARAGAACSPAGELLERGGLHDDREFRYLEVDGGQHSERDWGAALRSALEFFFGESPT